jgi:Family of unknown function (DUF6152)
MRSKSLGMLAAVLSLLFAAMPAMAHHSAAVQYDVSKKVSITGTLVKVEWQNPHNWYYVDVKEANGTVTHWAMEGAPPGHLFRDGVKRSTILDLVGNTVTVEGSPARDGSKNMSAHKMMLTDGKEMPM